MEIKSNIKCQLIIEGLPEKVDGFKKIEVILHNEQLDNFAVIVDRTEVDWTYDMPSDGLYIYYEIDWPEDESIPNDFIGYMMSDLSKLTEWERLKHFSICKLRHCTMELEKEMIYDFISNCNSNNCDKKSSEQYARDILLIGIFVLENLICQQRYSEATMILDSLTSCNLCKDSITKKCNC